MFLNAPGYDRFPLLFSREADNPKEAVTELAIGPDWFANERYRGPRTISTPDYLNAYVGNYIADSPWLGGTRVILRNGKLWMDGATELIPEGGHLFRPADPVWSPERIEFYFFADGKARVLRLDGTPLYRAEVD